MRPLLRFTEDGQDHRLRDTEAALAAEFGLTDEELAQLTPSGSDLVFWNRIRWAKLYLTKAGLLLSPAWGKIRISDLGREALKVNPSRIDLATLKTYPHFMEFWNPSKAGDSVPPDAQSDSADSEQTPEESIASTYRALRKHIEAEVLTKLIASSPSYFERTVVKLLTTIGYGGSLADAGAAIGRSGDGGIDGVIKEDKLGLDLIYIQAKKWADTTVGSPDVQGFVGALAGKKARKGVFITTSKFSRDARVYADSLENKVILIDGERLAELMYEYGLGVSTVSSYDIKRIDGEFFEEDEL